MKEGPLRELLAELDIRVLSKNHRGWLLAKCPFAQHGYHIHGVDRNPSFNVKIEADGLSAYKCWSCGQKGTIRALSEKLGYLRGQDTSDISQRAFLWETPDSFADYEERPEFQEQEPLNEALFVGMYPYAMEDPEAWAYLESRNITEQACADLQLLFDPDQKRILFPIRGGDDALFGWAGRSILPPEVLDRHGWPKVRNYAGLRAEGRLLGENLVQRGAKPLLVVEGLFAVASLVSRGARQWCNPVGVLGSELTEGKRDLIVSIGLPVILLPDLDLAGDKFLYGPLKPGRESGQPENHEGGGAIDMLREHLPVMVGLYPEDEPDVDDLTAEEIEAIVKTNHILT